MALVHIKISNYNKRLPQAVKYARFNPKYFEDTEKIKKKISYARIKCMFYN